MKEQPVNVLSIMLQDGHTQTVAAALAAVACVVVTVLWVAKQRASRMPPAPLVPPFLGDTVGLYSKGTLGLFWPRCAAPLSVRRVHRRHLNLVQRLMTRRDQTRLCASS